MHVLCVAKLQIILDDFLCIKIIKAFYAVLQTGLGTPKHSFSFSNWLLYIQTFISFVIMNHNSIEKFCAK